MSKQDRTYTRTASEVERKYNLGKAGHQSQQQEEKLSQLIQALSACETSIRIIEKTLEGIRLDVDSLFLKKMDKTESYTQLEIDTKLEEIRMLFPEYSAIAVLDEAVLGLSTLA